MLGPQYGPMLLNTTFLDSIFSQLIPVYGRDQPMSVQIKTSKAPTTFFKTGEVGIKTTFDINLFVKDQLAVSFEIVDGDGSINLKLTNGTVSF